ncbi:MAG: pseudouridine synthase [Leptospiraceae bacterium]|nr:pseudouridine synthase [Leptospiraceae bacterium]MDW7975074.1 pseudouridine synthase [Leptospiraceae bacterium]
MNSKAIEEWISKIEIIDHNPNFLVLYKPEGLAFYEESPAPSLLRIVRVMEQEKIIPEGERLFPVHRLDKITSGVIIFARGRKASNILGNHFRFHRIKKIYLALSYRIPKKKQGAIVGDIQKDRRSRWKLLRTRENPTYTFFKSFPFIREDAKYFRIFLVMPITGKTHQVRVVLKSLGSPIVGDPLYGKPSLARREDRTYLHSYGMKFTFEDKNYEYVIPPKSGVHFLHKEFQGFLKQIGNPFELPWKYKIPPLKTDL